MRKVTVRGELTEDAVARAAVEVECATLEELLVPDDETALIANLIASPTRLGVFSGAKVTTDPYMDRGSWAAVLSC